MSVNTDEKQLINLFSYPQAIVHVDCDAFFTSCEQARDPSLKNRPVATGQERGIVSCPSYEAKARGVMRGMRLGEAKKCCPELCVLPSDYELYSIYSQRVFDILRRYTPQVEEYSIDEAFCDLTGLRRMYRMSYPNIALMMKEAVQKEVGLTVSVGISLSKTLAKICSKHKKPDGFVALPGDELHIFLDTVPLERVCGFGPNTVALLQKCGVRNVGDYVRKPQLFAERSLGKVGVELWQELRGKSVYAVCTSQKQKYLTISKTKTFMPVSGDCDFVKAQLMRNLESACIKLRRHGLSARTLTVYVRRSDFHCVGIEGRLNRHSSATLDFTGVVSQLFPGIFKPGTMYRSTGVILSDILREGVDDRDLFEDPVRIERLHTLSTTVDAINQAYGKHTVHIAASQIAGEKPAHARNCISWRKDNLLKGETVRKRLNIPLWNLK